MHLVAQAMAVEHRYNCFDMQIGIVAQRATAIIIVGAVCFFTRLRCVALLGGAAACAASEHHE